MVEGEDPEVLADIARANIKLKNYLAEIGSDFTYWEADWKDTQELVEGVLKLARKYPSWYGYYVSGDDFGIDANYVFFSSVPLKASMIQRIGELVIDEGAELVGEEHEEKSTKMVFNLTVAKFDEQGNLTSERKPTEEEFKLFNDMFSNAIEKAENYYNGELLFVDETGEESFDFENPHPES